MLKKSFIIFFLYAQYKKLNQTHRFYVILLLCNITEIAILFLMIHTKTLLKRDVCAIHPINLLHLVVTVQFNNNTVCVRLGHLSASVKIIWHILQLYIIRLLVQKSEYSVTFHLQPFVLRFALKTTILTLQKIAESLNDHKTITELKLGPREYSIFFGHYNRIYCAYLH